MTSLNNLAVAQLAALSPIHGRKALQKLVYFSKVAEVPVTYRYFMHLYGPFSRELASDLVLFQAAGLLAVKPAEGGYDLFLLGPRGHRLLETEGERISPFRESLRRIVTLFGGFSPHELELYATTHFVADTCYRYHGVTNVDDIVKKVLAAKWKKEFEAQQVRCALEDLRRWELLA